MTMPDADQTDRRLTIAIIEHLKRLGYSQSDIAREYGVTRQAVSWHVRRYGRLTPLQKVFEHFPFQVPTPMGQASPFRLLRLHGEHVATGGVGMNDDKLGRLATFHRRLRGGLVLEFDPALPPEPGVSIQGGWRYLPRQAADGDLLIRENEHTMFTDEGRRIWRLPPA